MMVIEIPLNICNRAVFVQADRFGYIELIFHRADTLNIDSHFGRLDETQQGRIIGALGDNMLAKLIILQTDKTQAHKINSLIFTRRKDASRLAGILCQLADVNVPAICGQSTPVICSRDVPLGEA